MAVPDRSLPDGTLRPLAREPLRPQPRPEALGQAPAEVAARATVRGALALDRTALLGLFAGPEGRTALLRLRDGEVVRAAQGDVVAGGVVTAIGEDGLRLWQGGEERLLTMPA